MRPNRTLPRALSLAALAAFPLALLAGCVGEGELEPAWDAAVEALVEEVETGLWAGGGNPLADGNPLAYDYTCPAGDYDCIVGTCEKEVEQRDAPPGWSAKCSCGLPLGGIVRCVVTIFSGGTGGGEPEVGNSGVEGGGTPKGGDPGRPNGGGGGRGSESEEEKKLRETTLACDDGATRGTSAGCEVETELETDSILFTWAAGEKGAKKTRSGRGYSSWEGTATDDRLFTVMFVWGRRMQVLASEVTVSPREWSLPERSADLKWVDKIPDEPKAWGYYQGGEPSPDTLEGTTQGSGPWEGRYILSGKPTITAAAMYAHNDLKSGGPEYAIPESVTICGLSGVSRGVYALNRRPPDCDYGGRVDDFRRYVDEHENGHQNSLNKCIKAVNTDGRLAAVEAIVEGDPGEAEKAALTLWTKELVPALAKAKETDQEGHETDFWHWRWFGSWTKGERTGDHSGTDGCPKG